jgi:hypothetical protein
VDLFAAEPFDFAREHDAALIGEVAKDLRVPFVRLSALIALKEAAGRPRDLDDAEQLRRIQEEVAGGE